jgi:hypothetical protein
MRVRVGLIVALSGTWSAAAQLVPTRFIENRGQWDAVVMFATRWPGLSAVITDGSIRLTVPSGSPSQSAAGDGVQLVLEGLRPATRCSGTGLAVDTFNFFLGTDPNRWRSHVPGYRTIAWHDDLAAADVEIVATTRGPSLRWTFEGGAGSNPVIVGRVTGQIDPSVASGSMQVTADAARLSLLPAEALEHLPDGSVRRVACQYVPVGGDRIGISVDRANPNLPMTVTSEVDWSTYLGGLASENIAAIMPNPIGDFLIVGVTESFDFPTTPGSYDVTHGDLGQDMFVAEVDSQTGLINWSTFIGGIGDEQPTNAMLTSDGDILITGRGNHFFPVTPGAYFKPPPVNLSGAFACRLSSDGTELLYACLAGASSSLVARSAALTDQQEVVIIGDTIAQDLPVTPDAFDPTSTGIGDQEGFILKFSSTGSDLLYASYFGGAGNDNLKAVAVDMNGDIIIGGNVKSPPPLPPGAFQTESVGEATDPYIARFAPDLSRIIAATYFGGGCVEDLRDLAIGPDGSIILAGWTCSTNMPTTPDAFQPTLSGGLGIAGFVTRFNPMLTDLVFSTFIGSGLGLRLEAIHVDGSGLITVAGRADSDGFPVTAGAFDPTYNGGIGDMVVGRLRPDGKKWYYGSYVGGTKADVPEGEPVALGVDDTGAAVVGGFTVSEDYPTTAGAWQGTLSGPSDVGLTKLTMLPTGVARFGSATPGSLGLPAAGVTAMPKLGSSTFGVTCTQGPPARSGLLALSLSALDRPLPAVGVGLWIDPTGLLALLPTQTDGLGFCELRLRIPSNPAAVGLTAFAQFVWKDPAGPAGWSASNALAITVQP